MEERKGPRYDEFGEPMAEPLGGEEQPKLAEKPKLNLIPKKKPEVVEAPKPTSNDDSYTPNLSQLNINRAFGVMRTDEFDSEYYGDGEWKIFILISFI